MARPKGSFSVANLPKRLNQTLNSNSHQILIAVIEQALSGDLQSQKSLMDKFLPSLKAEPKKVVFVMKGESLAEQAGEILFACSNGEINHEVASSLINSLSGVLKIKEAESLEQRLKDLEKALSNRPK
jgi:hypothetical protein